MLLSMDVNSGQALRRFIEQHRRLFVLTGAGCSTDSGIPDYRDAEGQWKRSARPVTLQDFLTDAATRRRYWARSLAGWQHFRAARPNDTHRALACLQRRNGIAALVTQNVDGLHQAAGSSEVIDLHGRLDRVRCLHCGQRTAREALQGELLRLNAGTHRAVTALAPDGDAELADAQLADFQVPACARCGGILKPDVVFFGESVPPERVERAMLALCGADAVLVVGSSLMLYSGYRFAREGSRLGKPIVAVNLGRTRADELLSLKICESSSRALSFLLEQPQAA